VKAAKKLDAIVRNHFRDDAVVLDVCHHVRHIENMAVRRAPQPSPSWRLLLYRVMAKTGLVVGTGVASFQALSFST
jgi:hypothetical protein